MQTPTLQPVVGADAGGGNMLSSGSLQASPADSVNSANCNAAAGGSDDMSQFVPRASIVIDPKEEWMRTGDWICENCNDVQFRKNLHCRCCGNPSPFLL